MFQIEKDKQQGTGLYLKQVDTDTFQIHSAKHGAFEGDLRSIWQKMHWDFEVENKEIRMALSEMQKNDHTVAHFGIFGSFIFTSAV